MTLIASISDDLVGDDRIKYLVIESDEEKSGGFFLFLHQSLDFPCEADMWFTTLEKAKRQVAYDYGIKNEDWVIRP